MFSYVIKLTNSRYLSSHPYTLIMKNIIIALRALLGSLLPLFFRSKQQQPKLFLETLREHLADRALKKQLSDETKRKYGFCYDKVQRYLQSINKEDLTVHQVTIPIFEDFRRWMHKPGTAKSCGLTHSSRHLEICIGAMKQAVRDGHIKYNPIAELETGRDKRKKVIHLDKIELQKFIFYNFNNPGFLKAQVLFIFACSTGISYANLFDYQTTIDPESGGLWIEDNRKKVGKTPFYVPLDAPGFEIAKAIHLAYNGQLPKLENGTYNRYLKEMAAIVGILKNITSHTARKTFATLMDEQGFSLGVIAAILGNSEEVCKSHYINPSKKKIAREVNGRKVDYSTRDILGYQLSSKAE